MSKVDRTATMWRMAALRIIALTVLLACVYGIVHDQITARICVEYFTVGHQRIIASESPTALGLVWGVVATWWMGVLIGVPLAAAARLGGPPYLTARQLVRPALVLLVVMGCSALVAGLVGHRLAAAGRLRLDGAESVGLDGAKEVAFLTDLWAHNASYAVGFFGGIALISYAAIRRMKLRRVTARPPTDRSSGMAGR